MDGDALLSYLCAAQCNAFPIWCNASAICSTEGRRCTGRRVALGGADATPSPSVLLRSCVQELINSLLVSFALQPKRKKKEKPNHEPQRQLRSKSHLSQVDPYRNAPRFRARSTGGWLKKSEICLSVASRVEGWYASHPEGLCPGPPQRRCVYLFVRKKRHPAQGAKRAACG